MICRNHFQRDEMKLCSDPIIAFFILVARLKFYTLATIVDEIAARAEGA